MRRIKEVLRLRYKLKLDQRQIARSCSLSVSTVHEYLKRVEAANVSWPLPDDRDEARVEAALFRYSESRLEPKKSPPDFAAVDEQLRCHRHVTPQLLWQEYLEVNPDGYRYSRFCELYQRWRKKLDVVMRQEHKAGEKAFIDWAGATIPRIRSHRRRSVAGSVIRSCPRRQFLHLGRSYSRPADGFVAARPHARLRLLGRCSNARHSRQHQDGRDQSVPLRSGS